MKLFLSSEALQDNLANEFTKLVGKEPTDIKVALIENAADTYAEEKKAWVYENRATLVDAGYDVELLDLRDYKGKPDELREKLLSKDAVWLNGGNTFYLRWILEETGGDKVIPELVKAGLVYGGGSAGILVAGATLKHIEAADDPDDAPQVIWDGMRIIEKVVMPHIGNARYGDIMKKVVASLEADGYEVIGVTDDQAAVFNNDKCEIVSK